MDKPRAVVERWFELYSDGTPTSYGSDAFLTLYSADLTWETSARNGDLAALRAYAAENAEVLRNRKAEAYRIVADDSHAVAFHRFSATRADSGEMFEADVITLFTVEDGLITNFREWVNT